MTDWDTILQDIQSAQPITVTDVKFKFGHEGMWVIMTLSDGQEHKALLNPYNVLHMGIDMYRLSQFMSAGTEMFFKPMEEAATYLPFTCACGMALSLKKRSPDSLASGVFCPSCKKQYWINWSEGVIRDDTFGDKAE